MRPYSAFVKDNKKRKNIFFGRTALEKARKSLDKFKFEKERELFSRLQHRINTEYIKSRKNNDFHKRDTRLNTAYQFVKEQQRLIRLDNQLKNFEKFKNHSYLFFNVNKKRAEKINRYVKEYKKKEKKRKLIIAKEFEKKIMSNKEYPHDIILQNLNDIKKKDALRNKALRIKLQGKEEYLNKYKEEKDNKLEVKRKESEKILQIRNYKINQLFTERNKQREEKGKKIEKRNEHINLFLSEKEKINEEKRNIDDNYTKKYHMYSGRIDNILNKKDLDKVAINQIQFMSTNEPALKGLGQNLN